MIRDDTLDMPNQLRDARWKIDTAGLPRSEAAGLAVCGMGGSAIGGDLAIAVLGDRCVRPMITVRGYDLPAWVTSDWLVLCSSYSGNTEETLSCFEAAENLGARRIIAGTGGRLAKLARVAGDPVIGMPGILQPRAAVAYMLVIAAEAAALGGVSERIQDEIDSAAAFLESEIDNLQAMAVDVAVALKGTIPVIYGAGLTAPIARRWKTQINENVKAHAFYSELPEADHNEISGWGDDRRGSFSAVFLEDEEQHPREQLRIELTSEIIEASGALSIRIDSNGGTRGERLLWTVLLGDLVSLELAARAGVDPVAIPAIEGLKERMNGS